MHNFNDQKFMNLALNLARKNIGFTAENPTVGCVIVKNNIILSTAVTSKNGRPHAEHLAITKLKDEDLLGATIYITLEPCAHFGKTSPCVDLIIEKKIGRAVISIQDPDSRVNGQAIKKLQENKIQVEIGLLANEAFEINRGFFKSKIQNQPFVTLKLATSLDGKIALQNFESKWITNEKSREFGHLLRAQNNAILIGSTTVQRDNPLLDCRILGLEEFSPIRIILSENLNLDLNQKIFQNQDKIKTLIATNNENQAKKDKFLKYGIEIIFFKNLIDFLNQLSERGINNLLIEGGSRVAASFLKENLVDEILHFQGNQILGNDAIGAINDLNLNSLILSPKFKKVKTRDLNGDQLTIWQKNQ